MIEKCFEKIARVNIKPLYKINTTKKKNSDKPENMKRLWVGRVNIYKTAFCANAYMVLG